jgi:O-succinylbenzoic acid--CoA ligase
MLQRWVGAVAAERPFLWTDEGTLTYGDLDVVAPAGLSQQVAVEPEPSLDSVVELMTGPAAARQMVVLDPRLPEAEKERRLRAASAARERDALTVLFTSGTTGPAKAVRLTASNWMAAARASALHLGHRADDVWLATLPLHHVGGLSILYRTAWVGAGVRLLPRFDVATVAEELRGKVTIASLVPTMLGRVLDHDRGTFTGVRAVLVGGGPIPAGLLEEAHGRGLPALPTYGMTETCAQVATLRPGSAPRYAAHPLPDVEARIGSDRRIELRGPQVSPGYADEDDRAPGEWFATPDRGELDGDGALRILGRADRVIVTGGENVDPGRVEGVLLGHPEVKAAAVVGLEDAEWGTAVVAAYEGTVDPDQLGEWARQNLASHERPKRLRRVDRIPTVGPGKPDRTEVEKLLSRTER